MFSLVEAWAVLLLAFVPAQAETTSAESARQIIELAGVRAGLCVHLGCGREVSAGLTAELAARGNWLVHGLASDDAALARAQQAIEAKGVLGRAMAEKAPFGPLPYLRDLANVVVIEDSEAVPKAGLRTEEVRRITAPGGCIVTFQEGKWIKTVKPRPKEMDEWTHPRHGPDGNPVSTDALVRFPVGVRWQDGIPMNFTMNAACRTWVSAGGRIFTLGTTEYENLSPAGFLPHKAKAYLTTRDAFNGLPLWKLDCQRGSEQWCLNARNTGVLVTDGPRVYTRFKDQLAAADAVTGAIVATYPVKYPTMRMVLAQNILVAAGWEGYQPGGNWDPWVVKTDKGQVEAYDVTTGQRKWVVPSPAQDLLVADGLAYLLVQSAAPAKGEKLKDQQVVGVDLQSGKERWRVP